MTRSLAVVDFAWQKRPAFATTLWDGVQTGLSCLVPQKSTNGNLAAWTRVDDIYRGRTRITRPHMAWLIARVVAAGEKLPADRFTAEGTLLVLLVDPHFLTAGARPLLHNFATVALLLHLHLAWAAFSFMALRSAEVSSAAAHFPAGSIAASRPEFACTGDLEALLPAEALFITEERTMLSNGTRSRVAL